MKDGDRIKEIRQKKEDEDTKGKKIWDWREMPERQKRLSERNNNRTEKGGKRSQMRAQRWTKSWIR